MNASARQFRPGSYVQVLVGTLIMLTAFQPLAWGQEQALDLAATSTQVQEKPSPQEEGQSPPESKSKKESERIFGVVPAFSITDAKNLPPLKSKDKFNLFVRGTLDPFPFVVYGIQAGIEQANDTHSGYGQGAAGYARRFGAALGDGTSARFFSTYAFPSLLHQDPRYFRKGEGSGRSRVAYSLSRSFVTRSDSGAAQPNWSNMLGKFVGASLSNLYYPAEDRGASLTLSRVAISLGYQTLGNVAIEFWPEIHRKFFGGKKKQKSKTYSRSESFDE